MKKKYSDRNKPKQFALCRTIDGKKDGAHIVSGSGGGGGGVIQEAEITASSIEKEFIFNGTVSSADSRFKEGVADKIWYKRLFLLLQSLGLYFHNLFTSRWMIFAYSS